MFCMVIVSVLYKYSNELMQNLGHFVTVADQLLAW
jgi:hypothetical protein